MNSHEKIRTKDGKEIGLTLFAPEQPVGKVMIVAPTGDVTQQLYNPFATWFCQQGFSVISFDYRGMGRSAPESLKGFNASMHQWAVLAQRAQAASAAPARRRRLSGGVRRLPAGGWQCGGARANHLLAAGCSIEWWSGEGTDWHYVQSERRWCGVELQADPLGNV